jgi:hypothetical protein
MDGCFLFVRELHSPVPGEIWLLSWGTISGSNGPGAFVMRVYAYDGTKFRTVWTPALLWGATAIVTTSGFIVKHVDEEHSVPPGWEFVQDDYNLSPDGVSLFKSAPVIE